MKPTITHGFPKRSLAKEMRGLSSSVSQPTPTPSAPSFPLFPSLPTELQELIWSHALSNIYVTYLVHHWENSSEYEPFTTKEVQLDYDRWMSLLLTGRASYELAKRVDHRMYGKKSRPYIWEMQKRWRSSCREQRKPGIPSKGYMPGRGCGCQALKRKGGFWVLLGAVDAGM